MAYDDETAKRDLKAAERMQAFVDSEIDTALAACLQSVTGRRLVTWLLQISYVGRQPFAPGAGDQTAFNCGELNVGQQILARILRVSPEAYIAMLKEPANGNLTDPRTDTEPDADSGKLVYPEPEPDPFADTHSAA